MEQMDSSKSATSLPPDSHPRSEVVDDSLQLLEVHGFLYRENADIGKLVDGLYTENRIRSSDVKLDYFRPTLERDPYLSTILHEYPVEAPHFRIPWGTIPGAYIVWEPDPNRDTGIVGYMLGSGSKLLCRDGSHRRPRDKKLECLPYGSYQVPDSFLTDYPDQQVKSEKGGVLFVRSRLAHQAAKGRSIMLGLHKAQTDTPTQ